MRRLEKEDSRRRWRELRELWNDYDPIGVMGSPNSPLDEYEAYVGSTLRLLEQGATPEDIAEFLEQASEHMGLQFDRQNALEHAARFVRWYLERWPATRV